MGLVLSLCAGCSGCYESSGRAEDAGISVDGAPSDVGSTEDAGEGCIDSPRLDPTSLPSCGAHMVGDEYPIETVSPGCERYLGTLALPYADVSDLGLLGSLRWIDGGLGLRANARLTSLAGLERLEHVGSLSLTYQAHIDNLAPLGRLRTVEANLRIDGVTRLTSLRGLDHLEEIGGNLELGFHSEDRDLVSLDGLACLRRVGGDVDLVGIRREEVDRFLARVEVGGTVTLDGEAIMPEGAGP